MNKITYKGFTVFVQADGKCYTFFPVNLIVSDRKEFCSVHAAKLAITKFIAATPKHYLPQEG